jgi:NADH-quinone oxidoreductase subunit N
METYISFAKDNLWSEIWPELSLCFGAILVLGIDLLTKSSVPKVKAGTFAILFQFLLLVIHLLDYLLLRHTFDRESFSGMLKHGIHQDIMRSFFLLSSLLVSIIAHGYLINRKLRIGEFHHLSMIATAGLMILCQAQHFIVVFVALETVALCFYPLVAFNRDSPQSLEAGIKYLIFGALSSALFLLGIVLLYGVGSNPVVWGATLPTSGLTDAFSFHGLYHLIFANPDHLLLRAGVVLVISGIAFKIGAAPFQIWVPDVYHGAPMPVTAFLAVSSKAAGFFVLLTLVNGPFAGMSDFLLPLLGFVATFTIFFGNLAACSQRNIKRMLGLSGVAHAGYLMVAVMASMILPGSSDRAVWILFFYLFTYLLASFAVFGVMGIANVKDDAEHEFSDYENLASKKPWAGLTLVVGLGSLAGIPPLAGFIGKLLLFSLAFETKLYFSLFAMVIGVVISIYYYFGWIREICFHPRPVFEDDEPRQDPWELFDNSGLLKITLLSLVLASIIFGVWQGPLGDAF